MEHANRNNDSVNYDELYKSCSPKHFKEIKYFSTDGKSMPNGHSFQRGGFLQECRRNLNNIVLSEAVHGKQYHSSEYNGGVIVFSAAVNAAELDEAAIKNKVKMIIAPFQQRYFGGKTLRGIINKLKQYFKKKSVSDETIAFAVGNAFKGKYRQQ